jgi:hypothetical protein
MLPEMVPGGPGDGGWLPPQQHAGMLQTRLIKPAVGRNAATRAQAARSCGRLRMAARDYLGATQVEPA